MGNYIEILMFCLHWATHEGSPRGMRRQRIASEESEADGVSYHCSVATLDHFQRDTIVALGEGLVHNRAHPLRLGCIFVEVAER